MLGAGRNHAWRKLYVDFLSKLSMKKDNADIKKENKLIFLNCNGNETSNSCHLDDRRKYFIEFYSFLLYVSPNNKPSFVSFRSSIRVLFVLPRTPIFKVKLFCPVIKAPLAMYYYPPKLQVIYLWPTSN